MELDDHFYFGKYKGLTLREVYQGSEHVDRELLKAYIIHKIETPNLQDMIAEFMTYEVSDTLLRVKCDLFDDEDSLNEDLAHTIEKLFRDTITWTDDQIGNLSIDNFNTKRASQRNSIPIVGGGHPEYIDWCIRSVDEFNVNPDAIVELQSLTVFRLLGIKITRKLEDIYEYGPKVGHEKFSFSERVLEKNQEKYEAYIYNGRSNYNDNDDWDDNRWDDDDDDDYCDACQQSPCMCSDPDPG